MSDDASSELRAVRIAGSPHDMGLALGRAGRAAVHDVLCPLDYWAAVTDPAHDAAVARMATRTKAVFPWIYQELQGLADGLGLPFRQVMAWNCRGDLMSNVPDGCTTVQFPCDVPVIAHNEDGLPEFRGHAFMIDAAPLDAPEFTALCYPGSIPGHTFAMTGAGLVQAVNNLRLRDVSPQIPRMVVGRAVLACGNVGDALDVLSRENQCGGFHFTLAQVGDGVIHSIEFGGGAAVHRQIDTPSAHANHALHLDLPHGQSVTQSSADRQKRATDLIEGGIRDALAILRDKGGQGLPIHRCHPDDPDHENTLATAIIRVEKGGYDGKSMTNDLHSQSMPDQSVTDKAPQTVTGLRELMLRIAKGEGNITLGPKAREALARILDLQGDPALLSITSLADRLGVNPSTLTRLARNLGYSGFGAFQQVLLNASMSAPGSFYSRQAETALRGGDGSGPNGVAALCRESQANIDRFLDMCDQSQFRHATELIAGAPRVMVYGIRQFHAFASFLVYGLRMIRSDVHLLDSNALGVAEGIASMGPQDVLVISSCAPYSRQVVEVARAAVDKPVSVVAITDRADSPLIMASKAALLVPHETSFLSNSLSTFVLAAECLINSCAAIDPKAAKAALAERDRMISRLGIEL